MKREIPDIEFSTIPLGDDWRSKTESKQAPLRRRHHLCLKIISPYFYPTLASPFWRQLPPFKVWAVRIITLSLMICATAWLVLQLPKETGKFGRKGATLAVYLLFYIPTNLVLMLLLSHFDNPALFNLSGEKSPEIVAKSIREVISRDVLSATCTSVGELKDQLLKYEDLDDTTQNDISQAIKCFTLCLIDPKQEITSFVSTSECWFRFSIYLFAYCMLMIASFYCNWILFGELGTIIHALLAMCYFLTLYPMVLAYWKSRFTYAELVVYVRRRFFYTDMEKEGPTTLETSPEWWMTELSKKPFEELKLPEEAYCTYHYLGLRFAFDGWFSGLDFDYTTQ